MSLPWDPTIPRVSRKRAPPPTLTVTERIYRGQAMELEIMARRLRKVARTHRGATAAGILLCVERLELRARKLRRLF